MAQTYTLLPFLFWSYPVASVAALPPSGALGEVHLTTDTGGIYWWNGSAYEAISTPGSVPTTRTISTTAPLQGGGDLSANRTLSITLATALADGYLASADWSTFNAKVSATRTISTTAPLTGGGDLSANRTLAMPAATTLVDGYLTSTDWNTFNNKQASITAGTTSEYYRGDKTFQTLNIAALLAVTDGSAAASGVIGQIATASQSSNTTTGVGATSAWGAVTSLSVPAGRWLLWGSVGFNENGATLTTSFACGISASATGVGIDEFDTTVAAYQISGAADALMTTPHVAVNLAGATTYYLNSQFYYSAGTPRHRGKLTALRIG